MRTLASFVTAALLAPSLAYAQTPLPLGQPMVSANQGNIGGGIYFNMTVNTTVTIDTFTYLSSDSSSAGNSSFNMYINPDVWQGNVSSNPGNWILVADTVPVPISGGQDEVVIGQVQPAGANPGTVTFAPGSYGVALEAVGHSWGYQNGSFDFINAELHITTGGAQNEFLTLPTFEPRTINGLIEYTNGGMPMGFAARVNYGSGCYAGYQSFYEGFPNPQTGFDLNQTSMLMTYVASSNTYDVTGANNPVVPSVGVPLAFANDNANATVDVSANPIPYAAVGGTNVATMVDVSVDGFISFVPGSNPPPSGNHNPSVGAFLNGGARFGTWHDMDISVSGTIVYEYSPISQAHVFTWSAVRSRNNAGTNTFQILIYGNGDIETRWGLMNVAVGGGWPTLVGYTPGGGALDPNTRDLYDTTGLPPDFIEFSTQPADLPPLGLVADNNPVIGTTLSLTTFNEAPSSTYGLVLFGLTRAHPPFDLTPYGAPGCFVHIDDQVLSEIINNGAYGMTVYLPIPNNSSLVGFEFFCQSVWRNPGANNLGYLTSNGVELRVGSF